MASYDVIVIGSGPGGYVCAIRCAQLGLSTACVEKRETLGGTCLNVGCIPSKALLYATEQLHQAEANFSRMGIQVNAPAVDWGAMRGYKDETVASNTKGVEFLFKKNKIDWLKGTGKLAGTGRVEVDGETHEARHVVIATGSTSASLPGVEIDERQVVSSTGALDLAEIPGTLVVIGGGYIGLEMGSVFSRLGAEVTVLEYLDRITPAMDAEVSKAFQRILSRQGLAFTLGAAVQAVDTSGNRPQVRYTNGKEADEQTMEADAVLVATGRKPVTEGLALDAAEVETDRGMVVTDAYGRTNLDGVWAIGDVTDGPMLAHKAEDEGMAVAESIAGQAGHVNYGVIPSVVYTHPEVAAVGQTEEALKDAGRAYRAGKFQFMGNGRAKANFAAEGFVKILTDATTDRILGAHVIGPMAGDLIHEICVAMEFGAAAEDVARTCHAHPTYSEAVREAALACGDGAIHA